MLKIQLYMTEINNIKSYSKIKVILNSTMFSIFYCFCCTLDQIKVGSVRRGD